MSKGARRTDGRTDADAGGNRRQRRRGVRARADERERDRGRESDAGREGPVERERPAMASSLIHRRTKPRTRRTTGLRNARRLRCEGP